MSQYDFGTIDPTTKSGTALASDLNSWRTALNSLHKGSSRPAYAVAGMQWIDDSVSPWTLKMYDGADDISLGTINTTTNTFTATNAANLITTNWTVLESGGFLYFKYGGVNKARMDSSGNLICVGNVTAYGSI